MARVKADAKKRINAPGRAETAAMAKMNAKHDPSVVGTVTTKIVGNTKSSDAGAAKPKKRRLRPGTKALREIEKYQRSINQLIPRAAMSRLCREVVHENCQFDADSMRMTPGALAALQEASETFLVQFFEVANLSAIHAKRVTVMPADIEHTKTMHNRYTEFKFPLKGEDRMTTIAAYRHKLKLANAAIKKARETRKAANQAAAAEVVVAAAAAAVDAPAAEAPVEKKAVGRKSKKAAAAAAEEPEPAAEPQVAQKRPRKPAASKKNAAAAASVDAVAPADAQPAAEEQMAF